MAKATSMDAIRGARAPLDMPADEFRAAGHRLVEELAVFFETIRDRKVTTGSSVRTIRDLVGRGGLPMHGQPATALLDAVVPLVRDYSLHNGHPRFFGYITSSAAPFGALADLLAAAMNPNVGKWDLSPVATEIEAQTVRWLAELVGFPATCGGVMVSGGNMANFLAFMAARRAIVPWNVRGEGVYGDPRRLTVYASRETHTWIEKAADLSGIGTSAIRWIATDARQRLRIEELTRLIAEDRAAGCLPFLVVGTAGSVSTGAIDPLPDIAAVAAEHGLWFHVDGAYGAPAAALAEAPAELKALERADSVALDPHKWLYCPLEAACTLVRDRSALTDAFSYRPPYYHFDQTGEEQGNDYYEHGVQNSRGFRALKVWLCLQHVGRAGYEQMIRDDIALARRLDEAVAAQPALEQGTQSLSITTFRYRPAHAGTSQIWQEYLDELNTRLLSALQNEGECYLSNAVLDGRKFLRACIVNFRTTVADVEALAAIVARTGRRLDHELRPATLSAD
jgi:glutamate/tyrosine decarboxylase-like PLP-dependent enzyme